MGRGAVGFRSFALACTGGIEQDMMEYGKAKAMFEQCIRIGEANSPDGNTYSSKGSDLSNLAGVCLDMEDYEGARVRYAEALAFAAKVFGKQHTEYAIVLNNQAKLLETMHQLPKVSR